MKMQIGTGMKQAAHPSFDPEKLRRGINLFSKLGTLSWIANLILLVLAGYQFATAGYTIRIDTFFIVVNVLNVVTFYLTYKVYDHLALLKVRQAHASESI